MPFSCQSGMKLMVLSCFRRVLKFTCVCVDTHMIDIHIYTHDIHTYTYIYIWYTHTHTYVCVCVCVCREGERDGSRSALVMGHEVHMWLCNGSSFFITSGILWRFGQCSNCYLCIRESFQEHTTVWWSYCTGNCLLSVVMSPLGGSAAVYILVNKKETTIPIYYTLYLKDFNQY